MSAPDEGLGEAPSASQAPVHLPYLPPPAEPAPPEQQRRNGRPVSSKPGSQINRRPRVPDPKDRVITFRCTSPEYELFETRAKAAGLAIGPYLRQRETGSPGPRAQRNPTEAMKLLAQILGHLVPMVSSAKAANRALERNRRSARRVTGRQVGR